ncbi:hypothetical protein PACTADRAFT_48460 [Pachysolen tannophilus NRRL Y-2460]|uniref:Kinetochore protein mis13 n=1 Tax=Pachysolen tannophilus NRRL Y-2460 TaxID=669874 RepID=A0A1E4TY23_PACTA|nr:hypothetical protein PACTADRAFT_48460 [Pachysolen tannophilus NRRL Y-2460]
MPNDKPAGLRRRRSTRIEAKTSVNHSVEADDSANESVVQRARRTNSSLSELLKEKKNNKNKKAQANDNNNKNNNNNISGHRKSLNFEEDDGFVFKRASNVQIPVTNEVSSRNSSNNSILKAAQKSKLENIKPVAEELNKPKKKGRPSKIKTNGSEMPIPSNDTIETGNKNKNKRKTVSSKNDEQPTKRVKKTNNRKSLLNEMEEIEAKPGKRGGKNTNKVVIPEDKDKNPFSFGLGTPVKSKTNKKQTTKTKKSKIEPPVSPPISSPNNNNNNSNNNNDKNNSDKNNNNKTPPDYYEQHETSIQMLLPISDSPVIKKNKALREKSNRGRSSLSNRGKRVSSIGNGFVAVPHNDVSAEEFYKHFDQSLPEPYKMRQLLIWCSKRLLNQENANLKQRKSQASAEEVTMFNIAKVIKEELIRDLVDGRMNTSWWNRKTDEEEEGNRNGNNNNDKTDMSNRSVKLLPNMQNVSNLENIKIYENRLKELKKEKEDWLRAYNDIISNVDVNQVDLDKFDTENSKSLKELSFDYKKIVNNDLINGITDKFDKLELNLIKNNSLERKIDKFEQMVNTLNSNSMVLKKIYELENNKVTSLIHDYIKHENTNFVTNLESGNDDGDNSNESKNNNYGNRRKNVVDTYDLLKGIAKVEDENRKE